MPGAGREGGRKWGVACNEYGVSVLQDANVLESCWTTMWIYLTLLNYTHKMVNFSLPQLKFLENVYLKLPQLFSS